MFTHSTTHTIPFFCITTRLFPLFWQNSLDFNFLQSHGQQKIFSSVSNLSVISAAFDEERRNSTKSKVLTKINCGSHGRPVNGCSFVCLSLFFSTQVLQLSHLSLHGSAPEGDHMHIDITTSMVYLHVSPPTIRTVTACLMSMAPTKVRRTHSDPV